MDKGKSLLKSYTFHTSRPKEGGIKGVRVIKDILDSGHRVASLHKVAKYFLLLVDNHT